MEYVIMILNSKYNFLKGSLDGYENCNEFNENSDVYIDSKKKLKQLENAIKILQEKDKASDEVSLDP